MWYYRIGFPPCLKVNWKQQIKAQISIITTPHVKYEISPRNPSSLHCILLILRTPLPFNFSGECWSVSARESNFQARHLSLAVRGGKKILTPFISAHRICSVSFDRVSQVESASYRCTVFSVSTPCWHLGKLKVFFFFLNSRRRPFPAVPRVDFLQ